MKFSINYIFLTHIISLYLHVLKQVKNWVKELRKMLGSEITLCIVGNKTDMEKDRHVSVEEAER